MQINQKIHNNSQTLAKIQIVAVNVYRDAQSLLLLGILLLRQYLWHGRQDVQCGGKLKVD